MTNELSLKGSNFVSSLPTGALRGGSKLPEGELYNSHLTHLGAEVIWGPEGSGGHGGVFQGQSSFHGGKVS